jgi:hypothetical protein
MQSDSKDCMKLSIFETQRIQLLVRFSYQVDHLLLIVDTQILGLLSQSAD